MSESSSKNSGRRAGRPPIDLSGAQWGQRRVVGQPRVTDKGQAWRVECLCGRTSWMAAKNIAQAIRTNTAGCCKRCAGRRSIKTRVEAGVTLEDHHDLYVMCERLATQALHYLDNPNLRAGDALRTAALTTFEKLEKMRGA